MVRLVARDDAAVPLQVLGELLNVLRRRLQMAADLVSEFVRMHLQVFQSFLDLAEDIRVANGLAGRGLASVWDGVLLASCERMRCTLLRTEDLQDGFRFGGVEIVSPFDPDGGASDRLARALRA